MKVRRDGPSGPAIRVERSFPVAPERVFDAWIDPDSLRQWMCPGDGTVTEVEVDARVGGRFRIVMRFGGKEYVHTGEYREIRRPERLAFTWVSDATRGGESLVTVELRERGGRTDLSLTHERLPDPETAEKHRNGWQSILEKFVSTL